MKKTTILLIFVICVLSCKEDNKSEIETENSLPAQRAKASKTECPPYLLKEKSNNLNISIFLDLSDRIEEPLMIENDLAYLSSISKSFTNHIKTKKLVMLNDKMQLFFNPPPQNVKINQIAQELRVHFTRDTPETMINETIRLYSSEPSKIYELARQDANEDIRNYPGSDIWRFFKDDLKDYSIDNCFRNILIILTDGYIYHEKTKMEEGNKTSYITPRSLTQLNLNKSNWREIIETKELGFIPALNNLNDIEVLVIGINNLNTNNPYTLDIIEAYWSGWLKNMGLSDKDFKIKSIDIPSNMEKVIDDFINN